jgi:hypothetical protein
MVPEHKALNFARPFETEYVPTMYGKEEQATGVQDSTCLCQHDVESFTQPRPMQVLQVTCDVTLLQLMRCYSDSSGCLPDVIC